MKHKNLFLLLIPLILSIPGQGQQLTGTEDEILIWNGPGPGSDTLGITQVITARNPTGDCTIDRIAENVTETGIIPFIAENPTGAAVVICPGGGYSRVVLDKEGSDIAEWLNGLGVSAFVVKYRLPMDGHANRQYVPLQDSQRAMRYVRGHAEQWSIDPDEIGIMGASAGGQMATTLATKYDFEAYTPIDTLDSISAKPDFMILLYPVVSMESGVTHAGTRTNLLGTSPTQEQIDAFSAEKNVSAASPITFMARAMDDTAVPEENCTGLRDALDAVGVSNELHQYANGGHGVGICLATGTDFANWVKDCGKWLLANSLTDSAFFVGVEPPASVEKVNVFPNPVINLNQLRIQVPNSPALTINLYNMEGKMLETLEVGPVSSGIYSFEFTTSGKEAGYLVLEMNTGSGTSSHLVLVDRK